jgi:Fatty acid desaturase
MSRYYADHTRSLRSELAASVSAEQLRGLHCKRPVLHFAISFSLVAVLALSTAAIVSLDRWYFWLPLAIVSGFALFDFTVLLHEVVHRAVLTGKTDGAYRLIGALYAVPSGISSTQFTRWHLDHHAALGSVLEDPKRHYLSPKINARWFKALYFTPALFPIYFRAAKREAASYEPQLRKTINLERNLTILFHLSLLATVVYFFGWLIAWKAYLLPYFFVFPVAFALNRLGQHYDINPDDPANWSTLVKGSWFWDAAYLFSNYHVEHHYFPSVPFYNLPKLQKLLMPFYERHGMVARGYGDLLWRYLVLNRKPHTDWDAAPAGVANVQPPAVG